MSLRLIFPAESRFLLAPLRMRMFVWTLVRSTRLLEGSYRNIEPWLRCELHKPVVCVSDARRCRDDCQPSFISVRLDRALNAGNSRFTVIHNRAKLERKRNRMSQRKRPNLVKMYLKKNLITFLVLTFVT